MDARMAVSPLGAGPASPDCKPGRRQKARLAREREIVRAASEVFAALGYDLANMQGTACRKPGRGSRAHLDGLPQALPLDSATSLRFKLAPGFQGDVPE